MKACSGHTLLGMMLMMAGLYMGYESLIGAPHEEEDVKIYS